MIDNAKQQGAKTIRCFVETIDEYNPTLIGLMNMEHRTKPRGGNARNAETLIRLRKCKMALDATGANVVRFSHGGSRKGASFTNDQGHNVRLVLQHYTGLGKTSINEGLAHAESVDDETLLKLAYGLTQQPKKGQSTTEPKIVAATKSFFRSIQKRKTETIMKLQKDNISPEELVRIISAKIWAAFNEDTTGKNATVFDNVIGKRSKPASSKKVINAIAEDLMKAASTDQDAAAVTPATNRSVQPDHQQDAQAAPAESKPEPDGATNLQLVNNPGEQKPALDRPEAAHISTIREQGRYLIELAESNVNEKDMALRVEAVIGSLTEVVSRLYELAEPGLAA